MATTKIGKKIQQAKADGKVTKNEVDGLIAETVKNKKVSKSEKKELTKLLKNDGDKFDPAARATLSNFLGETTPADPTTVTTPTTVTPSTTVTTPVSSNGAAAKIEFKADWNEPVTGALVAGGKLTFEYSPERAQLRNTHNGHPAWGVEAFIRLNPSGEVIQTKAIDFENNYGQPTSVPKSLPVSVDIPAGTTEVEIWFRNWTGASNPGEQYDSNFGANYRFTVAPSNG